MAATITAPTRLTPGNVYGRTSSPTLPITRFAMIMLIATASKVEICLTRPVASRTNTA